MKNRYIIDGDIAIVYANGKNRFSYFIVDIEDLEKIANHSWRIQFYPSYKRVETSYATSGKSKNKHLVLGRLLIDCPNDLLVDHIDCDSLNNRKSNLRLASPLGNSQNVPKHPTRKTSSKYKGVAWHKKKRKWIASVSANKKSHHLGYFTSEKDAAIAYNHKAKELHSEFAYLNPID